MPSWHSHLFCLCPGQDEACASRFASVADSGYFCQRASIRIPAGHQAGYCLHAPAGPLQESRDLSRIHFRFNLISFVYGLVVLWVVLHWKMAPRFRDWAEKFSTKPFLQSLVFSPLLLLTIAVLTLPMDIYDNWTQRRFGLSVQSWVSWAGDWLKAELISIIVGTILIWLLYS